VTPDAVRVAGLSHRYRRTVALDDVTLAIPPHRMVGLIGPDGVGKSTLLALIAGVRRIQEGDVFALGGDMKDGEHRRSSLPRIAYMPQGLGRNLYPTLSVFENLDFFGRLFGQPKHEREQRIADLLAATGLDPFPDRPAGKLSGGMKQKLSLCCSLIHDPDLLILDEPTTGVDPLSRRQFWELIDRIRNRRPNMSVIVATAYMEEAERFDWLAAMDDGRVIASGTPAELKARGGSKSTLDEAFINLLPPAKRAGHEAVVVGPRPVIEGPPAIEAKGLTCRFGQFTAVDHVSFRIERGEIFGFLGSNGCGKSTTMKMLTGLLPATEGESRLLGSQLDASDMATRQRVGYMSQSFSLYAELTVRQNLELHAHLFQLPIERQQPRIQEMLERFDLLGVADSRPESLPLGQKQRLQLAVAILHSPEVLILDEPTSGVDPVARDAFWRYLIDLSRDEGVTIFLSTHFMNEAERCDRISLMHAGKVLAVGTAKDLSQLRGTNNLEEAFIGYLEDAARDSSTSRDEAVQPLEPTEPMVSSPPLERRFELQRLWAYAQRETIEILRDPIRLAFSLGGPIILMLTFGYGITFDIENLSFAALDQDQTLESRELLEQFSGSRYFEEHPEIATETELDRRLQNGELRIAIEIPPNFGKDLVSNKQPEASAWLDGAVPFRAETSRSYLVGLTQTYLADQAARGRPVTPPTSLPVNIEARFRYNQAFKSVYSIVPGVFMLLLMLIPAMMTAVGVVREKESGSIANFRSTPITKVEFLLGKQLPYIVIALISFITLLFLAVFLFEVPVRGSLVTLVVGVVAYVCASTGFGLLISSFTSTQVAAIFTASVLTITPCVNFSGLLVPVSTLTGAAYISGLAFPAGRFMQISLGTFTKGLGFVDLWRDILVVLGFAIGFVAAATVALRKQEA
jgi:ribosome-dependent ATPase